MNVNSLKYAACSMALDYPFVLQLYTAGQINLYLFRTFCQSIPFLTDLVPVIL